MRVIPHNRLADEKGITYTADHIRRLVKQGKFPKPIQLGEARIAWVESEIDDWLKQRAVERDRAAA